MWKKIFLIILNILILAGFFVIWGYLNPKQDFYCNIDEIANQNVELRDFAFLSCQNEKFQSEQCLNMFSEFSTDENIEIVKFLDFVNIFFVNKEDNKDLIEQIITLSKTMSSTITVENEFSQLIETASDESLDNYLNSNELNLEVNESKALLYKNDEVVVVFEYNEQTQLIYATLNEYNETINFTNFLNIVKAAEFVLSQTSDYNLSSEELVQDNYENVLLLGQSGVRLDSIILMNVDYDRKITTLVSVPRDLWINSIRINLYYDRFGIDYFLKVFEDITGQKIDHYVIVDMLVFPELVDEIDGIDFDFEAPLIDPTYKTVDNGKVGSLYFSKGINHLNGIQSLRVARSRHTSNDFSRSARQHKIIRAIVEKLNTISYVKSLYKTLPIVLPKVKTDFGLFELIDFGLKAQNYKINSGYIMTNKNILQHEMVDVGNDLQAYTLKPRNNDWSLIKKFIINAIKSGQSEVE